MKGHGDVPWPFCPSSPHALTRDGRDEFTGSAAAGAASRPSSCAMVRGPMLGDRWLRQAQRHDDVADGALGGREEVQDVSPAGFGDGVEAVGGRGGAGHEAIICRYRNMSMSQPRASRRDEAEVP